MMATAEAAGPQPVAPSPQDGSQGLGLCLGAGSPGRGVGRWFCPRYFHLAPSGPSIYTLLFRWIQMLYAHGLCLQRQAEPIREAHHSFNVRGCEWPKDFLMVHFIGREKLNTGC